jgi:hypothetical protein
VKIEDGVLVILLSEDTKLKFERPEQIDAEDSQLVIGMFEKAILRWKEFGGTEYHERSYESGQVRLVPPLHTIISRQMLGQ